MRDRQFVERVLACVLALPVTVILFVLYVIVVPLQGRPFFFASERMKAPGESFRLLKIRTMHPPDERDEQRVLGGDLAGRVTAIGRILRKTRLDELPQIYNVLRGDMAFIGPRPPLRRYVETYPDIYSEVLRRRPGITGLATVMLHRREERLLSACRDPLETDRVYREFCIPMKARLDRIYDENSGIRLDAMIVWRTFAGLARRMGRDDAPISAEPVPVSANRDMPLNAERAT